MTDVAVYGVGIQTRWEATYHGLNGRSYQFNNPNVAGTGTPPDLSVVNVHQDDVAVLKNRNNLTTVNGRNRGSSKKDCIVFKTEDELTAAERTAYGLPPLP